MKSTREMRTSRANSHLLVYRKRRITPQTSCYGSIETKGIAHRGTNLEEALSRTKGGLICQISLREYAISSQVIEKRLHNNRKRVVFGRAFFRVLVVERENVN